MKTIEEVLELSDTISIDKILNAGEEGLIELGFIKESNLFNSKISHKIFQMLKVIREQVSEESDIILSDDRIKSFNMVYNYAQNIFKYFGEEIDFTMEDLNSQTLKANGDINRILQNEEFRLSLHIFLYGISLRISKAN